MCTEFSYLQLPPSVLEGSFLLSTYVFYETPFLLKFYKAHLFRRSLSEFLFNVFVLVLNFSCLFSIVICMLMLVLLLFCVRVASCLAFVLHPSFRSKLIINKKSVTIYNRICMPLIDIVSVIIYKINIVSI